MTVATLAVDLPGIGLATPLVAASGTVGSVVDFADTIDFTRYGAAVAKSVSSEPWQGRPAPRLAPVGAGMINGIGIQNPGIEAWTAEHGAALDRIPTSVWGSVVGHDPGGFAAVAAAFDRLDGIDAVEINLSCPNLEGLPFALDADRSRAVVAEVRSATTKPIGAKLSPDAQAIVDVAATCLESGADWLVVGNTVRGAAFDPVTRRPVITGVIGGYSGDPIRPIAVRCVLEISTALPDATIIGCGGVSSGDHVVEFLLAGATAVGIGSAHFAKPRIAGRILRELSRHLARHGCERPADLRSARVEWSL